MMKVRVEVLALVSFGLVCAFSSGCGDDATERAGENVIEEAIERAAKREGEEVEVDIGKGELTVRSKDGTASLRAGDESVAVKTDEGSMRIGAGTLPTNFPKDVPVYAGATVVQSMDMGKMVMATLETDDPFAKAVTSYEKECPGKGWTGVGSVTGTSGDPLRVLNYVKDDRSLIVSINRGSGKNKTIISLTVSRE